MPASQPDKPHDSDITDVSVVSGERSTFNFGAIDDRFKDKPDKGKEFKLFAGSVWSILSESERAEFARDPINFRSKELLFRGLTSEKVAQLKIDGEFKTHSGEQAAGTGVFLFDSPFSTFQYESHTIAVFERSRLALLDGRIVEAGSREYHDRVAALLGGLTPDGRKLSVWTVDEEMDLAYKSNRNSEVLNVSLRKPQPLSAVKAFLTYENGGFVAKTMDDLLAA